MVAEIAKEMGILTVAVVTKPFSFEGRKRMRVGEAGIAELSQHVDSLITIPNEKLLPVLGKNTSLLEAFKEANNVLLGAVQGIADLIIRPGMINVDFADVKTVMSEMGMAMMGTGVASGEDRAREAAETAIKSRLLEDVNLQGARGILVNITAGEDLGLGEFSEVGETIEEFASDNATVVVGTVIDPSMGDELKVTVVATGLGGSIVEEVRGAKSGMRGIPVERDGSVKYSELEMPAIGRVKSKSAYVQPTNTNVAIEQDMDYLDLPAFLRQQAD